MEHPIKLLISGDVGKSFLTFCKLQIHHAFEDALLSCCDYRFLGDDNLPGDDNDIMRGVHCQIVTFFAFLVVILFTGAVLVTIFEVTLPQSQTYSFCHYFALVSVRLTILNRHNVHRNCRSSKHFFGRFKHVQP